MPETLPIKTRLCHDCTRPWKPDEHDRCSWCGKSGMNESGEPYIEYSFSDPTDPERKRPHPDFLGGIVMTGAMTGTITLADGAVYDVTEPYIHCKPEHNGPIACVIHRRLHALQPWKYAEHVHSDFCGVERQS